LGAEPGAAGSDIEITVGDTVLTHTLAATGSWYDYSTVRIGVIYLPKTTDYEVVVRCRVRRGEAVMNLKAVTLNPTCEGESPRQSDDGTIRLHARDSTINGVLLQWEPAPEKRTIGYWANTNDFASWDFDVIRPGNFEVQIMQGCGAGQGGSRVELTVYRREDDGQPLAVLPHTVCDTGHWQAFEPVELGQLELAAGKYRLRADAMSRRGAAVMDLQQVLLRPVR
jgi:hypothetical protein